MVTVRRKRWIAVFQTALLSVFGVLVAGNPANAAVLTPGTVISSATATLPPEVALWGTGKRIQYVSTNVSGGTITATGLIITPKTNKKYKTVAWAHGSTGLADQCAPSTNQDVFWPEARAAVAELLKRGWTVAATDYPGLGTPAQHPYFIGDSEARSVIDSVKAARNLDYTLTTQYAIDGHSQGGQGALLANQIAPAYDGALVLRGTAAIAPVSNVDLFAPFVPGTPSNGYLVMALSGLGAADPSFAPLAQLALPAKLRVGVLQTGCLHEILDRYAPLTADQLLVGGALTQATIDKLVHFDNPAQSAPTAPILIVQGTDDEAVPYLITHDALLPELTGYGTAPVDFVRLEGANHDGSVFQSTVTVANWIAARFA
jgi:alpha-beta hydrolase superfamily lysophospholipase